MDAARLLSLFIEQQWVLLPLLLLALTAALFGITPKLAQAAFMREYRRRPPRMIGPERPRSALAKLAHEDEDANEPESVDTIETERQAA